MLTSSDHTLAVRVSGVSKLYQLGAGNDSLRSLTGDWLNKLRKQRRVEADQRHFWALEDVSFDVQRGETLGLIGPNGAGKTTTLKLLSRVTQPTHGTVTINGRFSSLIELGAGFHPDLTGRENVFLNGVILGLTRRQVKARFDEIVAFSELERFIDMPVKRYSSGMYARLGFAVAAHVDPDVMLVDEVLAVGDASFQQKCYDFLHAFVKSGRTTIFVSHNLYVMEQLCDRVIWLERGHVVKRGAPAEVLPAYLDSQEQRLMKTAGTIESAASSLRIDRVSICNPSQDGQSVFEAGEDIVVEIAYHAEQPIANPHFVVAVSDAQGGPPLFLASMLVDGEAPPRIAGDGVIRCTFRSVPLKPRAYFVWGEIWASDRARLLVNWQRLGAFRVVEAASSTAVPAGRGSIRHLRTDAPLSIPYQWDHPED